MALARAKRLFDADLARALLHSHQHDVHQPNACNAQCERAHQREQNLEGDGKNVELVQLGHQIRHKHGVVV